MLILNANDTEPLDYRDRQVVKGVILDDAGRVLMYGSTLVGGGIDEGETDEEALLREAIEEAGAEVTITRSLGEIIAYRDFLKRKYITRGYVCTHIRTLGAPTTTQEDEIGIVAEWENIESAIERVTNEIHALEAEGPDAYEGDEFLEKLYNRKMAVHFLKALEIG